MRFNHQEGRKKDESKDQEDEQSSAEIDSVEPRWALGSKKPISGLPIGYLQLIRHLHGTRD